MNVSRNIAALIITAGLAAVTAPAHAEDPKADKAHCVSTRESRAGFLADSPTQTEVERRWEVTGRGMAEVATVPLSGPIWYRWCDRPKGSYIGVLYGAQYHRAAAVVWYNINQQT